ARRTAGRAFWERLSRAIGLRSRDDDGDVRALATARADDEAAHGAACRLCDEAEVRLRLHEPRGHRETACARREQPARDVGRGRGAEEMAVDGLRARDAGARAATPEDAGDRPRLEAISRPGAAALREDEVDVLRSDASAADRAPEPS